MGVTVDDYRRAADAAELYIEEHRAKAANQIGYQRELDRKAAEVEFYAVAARRFHINPNQMHPAILADQVRAPHRTGLYDPAVYTARYNELLDMFEESANEGKHLQP